MVAALGDVVNGRVALWRPGLAGRPMYGALNGRDERQGGASGNGRTLASSTSRCVIRTAHT